MQTSRFRVARVNAPLRTARGQSWFATLWALAAALCTSACAHSAPPPSMFERGEWTVRLPTPDDAWREPTRAKAANANAGDAAEPADGP